MREPPFMWFLRNLTTGRPGPPPPLQPDCTPLQHGGFSQSATWTPCATEHRTSCPSFTARTESGSPTKLDRKGPWPAPGSPPGNKRLRGPANRKGLSNTGGNPGNPKEGARELEETPDARLSAPRHTRPQGAPPRGQRRDNRGQCPREARGANQTTTSARLEPAHRAELRIRSRRPPDSGTPQASRSHQAPDQGQTGRPADRKACRQPNPGTRPI